jgi:hypothetical protein
MDMSPHIDAVRSDLNAAAELGDDELRDAAARLGRALDASVRVRLLEVLGEAVHELNGQIEAAHIDLHLVGGNVDLVYVGEDSPVATPADADDDLTARITLRLPEKLKGQAETAAAKEGISTNAWLVRAVTAGLGKRPRARSGSHVTGYAQS